MKTITTTILLSLFSTSLYAANSYLCIAEHAAGFKFNKKTKEWFSGASKATNKFIVKRTQNKKHRWIVSEHGVDDSGLECKSDFNVNGFLQCESLYKFEMNNQTMRFRYDFLFGYVVDKGYLTKSKDGEQSPYVVIGKCSKL